MGTAQDASRPPPIPDTSPRPVARIRTATSYETYVTASLEEVEIGTTGVCPSRIGAMAYRGPNRYPVVLVHFEGVSHGLDEEARFTAPDEARQLAQYC